MRDSRARLATLAARLAILEETVARMQAQINALEGPKQIAPDVITVGPMVIDRERLMFSVKEEAHNVSRRVMRVLWLFAQNAENIVTPEMRARLWESHSNPESRSASARQGLSDLKIFLLKVGCRDHLHSVGNRVSGKYMLSAQPIPPTE